MSKVVYFGQGGVVPSPEEGGYVVLPYAGEKLETPLFKAYRVVNMHPSVYALYKIYEVKAMDKTLELTKLIEGLNITPLVSPDRAYTVVPIEPDMIEEALSWGAIGFGIEAFAEDGTLQLIALFREETSEGEDFADFYGAPVDFLYPPQFATSFRSIEKGDLDFYLNGGYDWVSALYGGKWLIYLPSQEPIR